MTSRDESRRRRVVQAFSDMRVIALSLLALVSLLWSLAYFGTEFFSSEPVEFRTIAPATLEHALPEEGAVDVGAGALPQGEELHVECVRPNGEDSSLWLQLTNGSWVRSRDVVPAAGDPLEDDLPSC